MKGCESDERYIYLICLFRRQLEDFSSIKVQMIWQSTNLIIYRLECSVVFFSTACSTDCNGGHHK
ncbi:hypothetical protein LINPERPRIM_LOCUS24251, partial [Linum perenne]